MNQVFPIILIIGTFLLAKAGIAGTTAQQFIPRYTDYFGELVVQGVYKDRVTDSGRRSSSNSDLALQEFIRVKGRGFVYSPYFITLTTDAAVGLEQERMDITDRSYEKSSSLYGFRQDLTLLPSHPYNLYMFAGRSQELVQGGSGVGQSGTIVLWEYGIQARYEKRPWQSTLSYTHNKSESVWDSVTDTYGANLYYFDTLDFLNINTSYNHFDSSRYSGLNNTVKDVFGAHLRKQWEQYRLLSRVNIDQHEQDDNYLVTQNSPDYHEQRQRWEWYNELAADLTHNIDSVFSYRKTHSDTESQRGNLPGSAFSDTDNYRLRFTHHLFKSVKTTLNGGYRTTESSGGATDQQDIRLNSGYSKIIPWGNVNAGLSAGITDTTNTGSQSRLSEKHTLSPTSPTSFTLEAQVVDPDTVRISVVDHINDNITVPLTRNVHYLVVEVGRSHRVVIIGLPPGLNEPWVTYSYLADYETPESDYTLRGTNYSARLRANLFKRLITPHTSFNQYNQDVVSGFFPGEPNNSRGYNLGLTFNYQPFNGDVTRSWSRSEVESEDRLTAWITYDKQFQKNAGGSCTLSFENRNIWDERPVVTERERQLDENIYAMNAQLYKSWPSWNLSGNISGNYSEYHGIGQTTTAGLFTNLTWHYGKMDLSFRASYAETDSVVADSETNSNYSTVWFMIRRRLF